MPLSKFDRETLEHNHRVRMQPQAERQAELQRQAQAAIEAARENLKQALEADRKSGRLAAADLRHKKMEKPSILSEKLPWDADTKTRDKFATFQRAALREWYEYVTMADPSVMNEDAKRDLPAAALYFIQHPEELHAE